MSPDKMIHMANQIASFFATQPGEGQAAAVAKHLTSFWDPRMLAQLHAHVAAGGAGLTPLALEAARSLAEPQAA
jgi:formate dehydrogenase subunit delta